MSLSSQAVSSRSVSSKAALSSAVAAQSVASRYSTATDLPNFSGYHAPKRPVTRRPDIKNPLGDLISDELFEQLSRWDLINEKALRDFIIRRTYQKLREEFRCSRADAIELVQENYPYLQGDTIRKIIYKINPAAGRKSLL